MRNNKYPRILYVYQMNPVDINSQSGRPYSILCQFEKNGCDVDVLVLGGPIYELFRYLSYALDRVLGKKRDTHRSWLLGWYTKLLVGIKLSTRRYHIIFSPSTIPFAYLDKRKGSINVACVDTLLPGFVEFYSYDSERYEQDTIHETRCLINIDSLIVPTIWASNQITSFDLNGNVPNIIISPFGANMIQGNKELSHYVSKYIKRDFRDIRIVTIVSDWVRKNGDLTYQVLVRMRERGYKVSLAVIGNANGVGEKIINDPDCILYGRLDKSLKEDWEVFNAVMMSANILSMPSQGEAFGMALCEAAAYSLPSIGSRNGGIKEIIVENETGVYLDAVTDIDRVCSWLESLYADYDLYQRFSRNAYQRYVNYLNWDSFYKNTFALMSDNFSYDI